MGYTLSCETCQDRGLDKIYEGETARSAHVRGPEYIPIDLIKGNQISVKWFLSQV